MERRKFIIGFGIALLAGPAAFSLKGCGGGGGGYNAPAPAPAADGFSVQSSVFNNHAHSVTVLFADLTALPSAGVTYPSTNNSNHIHHIFLSLQDLTTINNGGTVTVTSTIPDPTNHSHDWTITKQ